MCHELASRCGLYCGSCRYREKTNCPGCRVCGGDVFWGKCELAACSIDRQLDGCGKCNEFPCEKLKKFSYDKTYGDNGKRIENLQAWNEEGFDSWLQKKLSKE